MLQLFGAPGAAFFGAYDEVWPRADAHAERVALWQLFPLLVHAVLFGGGYGASAARAARRYV
jgi:fructosamine-3-kinase